MNESLLQPHRYRRYYEKITPLVKTPQAQAYTMVVLSLFSITFFGFLAIRPTLKTIATLQRQITDKSFVNEKLAAKINSLILAQEEYKRIEKDLPRIYALLPEHPEFPLLLREVLVLAGENDATISAIQFNPIVLYEKSTRQPATEKQPAPEEPVTEEPTPETEAGDEKTANSELPTQVPNQSTAIIFSLTFEGEYQNLVDILRQLTNRNRLITIHSVDLKESEENATLTINIESQSYYFPLTI